MPTTGRSRARWLLVVQVAAAIDLSGCASTNEVLAKGSDEVFHTKQTPDEVADCFARLNHLRIIEREDGAKVAQFRNGWGGVVKTFSIYPEASGSRIEVRSDAVNVPGYSWKRCVGLQQRKNREPVTGAAGPDR